MGNFCQLIEEQKNDDKNEENLSRCCCTILCGKICKHNNIYQSQAQIFFENINGDNEQIFNTNINERMYNDDNINLGDPKKKKFLILFIKKKIQIKIKMKKIMITKKIML